MQAGPFGQDRNRPARPFDAAHLVAGLLAAQVDGTPAIEKLDRLLGWGAELVLHDDVGRSIDDPLDEVLLEALHQGGGRDGEADAHGDPAHGDKRLAPARAQVGEGDPEQETHRPWP